MIKCKDCKREFKSKKALGSHWGKKHGPKKDDQPKMAAGPTHPKYGLSRGNQFLKTGEKIENMDFAEVSSRFKLGTIKKWLIHNRGDKCEECSFSAIRPNGKTILQLHHVNGIKEEITENNLKLLCPNCHVMTENWGMSKAVLV
jgi:hypothetical protein